MEASNEYFSSPKTTTTYTPHRFDRLRALQDRGPDSARLIALLAWGAISQSEKLELIYDAVDTFGSDHPRQQNAYLNARLIIKYLDGQSDDHHDFHEREEVHKNPEIASAFGGDASNLPPVT